MVALAHAGGGPRRGNRRLSACRASELAASLGDFGINVKALTGGDPAAPLTVALGKLGEVQEKLKDIQSAQARWRRAARCGTSPILGR